MVFSSDSDCVCEVVMCFVKNLVMVVVLTCGRLFLLENFKLVVFLVAVPETLELGFLGGTMVVVFRFCDGAFFLQEPILVPNILGIFFFIWGVVGGQFLLCRFCRLLESLVHWDSQCTVECRFGLLFDDYSNYNYET